MVSTTAAFLQKGGRSRKSNILGETPLLIQGRLLLSMRKTQTDDGNDQKTELEQIGICDHIITSLMLGGTTF